MITKDRIEELKQKDLDGLYAYLASCESPKEVRYILSNLGRLPKVFDGKQLLRFLEDTHSETRYWAVKNLGKLSMPDYLEILLDIAQSDDDSMVRREAVSSIGRMRYRPAIPQLLSFLQNDDPKIVLQAIRALLVFNKDRYILEKIAELRNHPNEEIQMIVEKELGSQEKHEDYGDHLTSPDFMKNTVVLGDVRQVMPHIPDGSIHLTFTSPPYYNARDYSIYKSYEEYLDFLEDVFRNVNRITKEGRFLIVNTSPVIVPRISRKYASKRYPIPFDLHARLMKIGWEFIDDIIWAKPEASVKNRNGGFMQHRKPLGYKPNTTTEYLMVYRKQTTKLLDWNMRQYPDDVVEASKVADSYETSNLWHIDPASDKVHTAVFPEALCYRVIQFYSFKNDLVFDPFGGSGTLGKVANQMQRYFFLTEQDTIYFERIKENIQPGLFQEKSIHFLTLAKFSELASEDSSCNSPKLL